MNPVEEIALLKRRVGQVESELADLKSSLVTLEARVSDARETIADMPPPPIPPRAEELIEAPWVSSPPPPFPEVASDPIAVAPSAPESTETWQPSPPPPVPVALPVEEPPSAPRRNPLREWLEPLQLWPPDGEENAEVRLAAWWTTRVGALLAVIGVVFLGIYVSHGSPPWVRLAEVVAATAGVLALGHRLERSLPKFGAVVFGAGLALSYFCAFAAYAVPPMRVLSHPLAAMAVEVAVVAAILGVAWRRNAQLVASMAVALGYVTAFVGLQDQRFGFGPWVILLLGTAAVVLRLARGWQAPSAIAMLATWVFLGVATFVRRDGVELHLGALWLWCGLHLALFTARDWIVAWRGGELGTFERALQVTNSSLAVAVGLLGAMRAGGDAAQHFFFGSGVAMLLLAWAWRAVKADALVPILVCKAASLIALGVIDALAGQARCLVLLAQAFVMLVSARHSHQRWLRIATAIAGAIAIGFYVEALRPTGAEFATSATALEVVFLAGALAFVAALHRWLEFGRATTISGSALVGLLAVLTAMRWALQGWTPAAEVALAALLGAVALGLRGAWPAAVAGVILLGAAHTEMWFFNVSQSGRTVLWWCEAAVLAGGVTAGLVTRFVAHETARTRLRTVIAALAAATLVVVGFKGLAPAAALALGYGVALLLVTMERIARTWSLAMLATPLCAFAWGLLLTQDAAAVGGPWLWGAVAAGWSMPIWFAWSAASLERIEPPEWRRWVPSVHTWLAVAVTLLALVKNLHGEQRVLGFTAAALATAGLVWRPRLWPALEASWIFFAGAFTCGLFVEQNAALWFATLAAWSVALVCGSGRGLEALRRTRPIWRAHAGSVQSWLATALTLAALYRTWSGERLVIGLACAALVAVVLLWRPGLRAALETSWAFWFVAGVQMREGSVAWAGWFVAVASWLPAILFARVSLPAAEPGAWSPWRRARTAIQAGGATLFTLIALDKNLSGTAQLGGLAVAALVVFALAWLVRVRPALESSWVIWVAAIFTAVTTAAGATAWTVAALAWLPVIVLSRGRNDQFLRDAPPPWRAHADTLQVAVASVLGVVVAAVHGGVGEFCGLAALVIVAAAAWRWLGVRAGRPAAAGVAAFAWCDALRFALGGHAMGWSLALAAVLAIAGLVAVLPLVLGRDLERVVQPRLRWPAAGAGLALAFAALVVQRGEVAPFATIGCGLAAVATFLLGLYARSRPHRLCGLAGLALCIPRAFIVDLHSTLHRIAAFVALGVVLLAVGFSYDRFRHFIDDDKKI